MTKAFVIMSMVFTLACLSLTFVWTVVSTVVEHRIGVLLVH